MERLNIQEIMGKSGKQILESIIHSKLNESEIKKATFHLNKNIENESVENKKIEYHFKDKNHYSIFYKKSKIGYIDLHDSLLENIKLDEVFEQVHLLVNRHITNKISRFYLGKGQDLIGSSDHILVIENFIKCASQTSHPVIIEGNSGCEKQAVASAIHYNSNRSKNSFYELNCHSLNTQNFNKTLLSLRQSINGGTLFIREIEHLTLQQQGELIQSLSINNTQCDQHLASNKIDIRYIISSSQNLVDEVKQERFLESLLKEFNYLKIKMPTLKDRSSDIPHILNFLLYENSDGKKIFSDQAIAILKNHHWPGNYSELERVGIRLIVLSQDDVITPKDIKRLSPEIFDDNVDVINHKILIGNLFNSNTKYIEDYHPGLQKSLTYIAHSYHKEITLKDLSDQSFVSPSHLSFLFRSILGKSFKQILTELRIEKIKHSFIHYPNKKITTSSLEVGFGDLSHFEKIFKKHTGMTPREYKNNLKVVKHD